MYVRIYIYIYSDEYVFMYVLWCTQSPKLSLLEQLISYMAQILGHVYALMCSWSLLRIREIAHYLSVVCK
jgi:hypothetical protein